jgi:uncharacterized protein YjiS (DUF1127 family)
MLYIYNMLKKQIIAAFRGLLQSVRSLWARYRHAKALYQSRSHLVALDDRELDDIGISRADRDAECARPIGQDKAPWIESSYLSDSPFRRSAIDRPAPAHIRGRPASHIRSFYNERGRCPTAR